MNRVKLAVQAVVAAVVLGAGMFVAPAAASASSCATSSLRFSPPPGSYVCGYQPLLVQWPDGHYQYFVVGTNSANNIYDSWELSPGVWSKWRNLGGTGRSGVGLVGGTSTWITIDVFGTDKLFWCKTWTSSSDWGSWYHC